MEEEGDGEGPGMGSVARGKETAMQSGHTGGQSAAEASS